ncbi:MULTISPECIES: RNase adapter RapZ [Corynebacterium]|uniref:RNase adapter RapZ n=1 Tax=Corynebacterium TaxID=1716 RepID=UPI0008A3315C|nr:MULTISPECIES: RNase adapter RapZ [Corynebacterium]MBC6764210.1 RNase adapter RapZ [Corynebacterium sp. LK22]MCA0444210.1 RNase adapter RapZ [Corynebacterium amycolatum]MCQ9349889.1 RNase adapter RapZ [Corynebacterium sp. 5QC2CO]MDK8506197.1 RNase adapter RapZ [Corynebacterium amycolatum]OFJ56293.1 RNase adaptor protein RapZ [Corynebacterium sp. HMSC076C10]
MITSGYSPQAEKSLVLITGMSGSGRNTAASVLEEMGWYVADNLPPELIMRMVELSFEADSPVERLAIVTDVRSRAFAGSLGEVLDGLRNEGRQPYVIFFDANDDTLIARYDSVRRTHPLQENGTLSQGIAAERQMLLPIKGMSDLVVDTSDMSVHDLRRELEHQLSDTASKIQQITIESFGFKHGAPRDADMLFDVRFLPNPYWVPELRAGRGTNKAVAEYVLSQPESQGFLDNVTNLIELVLPGYRREGKGFMTIAVGCTGGHHRSVAMSEALAKKLEGVSGINVNVVHRDIDRN